MKYGKLLIEGIEANTANFDVITVPRTSLGTIVTEFSEDLTDGIGQTEPIPLNWANYIIVEANDWTQTQTDIINQAVIDYNLKYPSNPIPNDTLLIW